MSSEIRYKLSAEKYFNHLREIKKDHLYHVGAGVVLITPGVGFVLGPVCEEESVKITTVKILKVMSAASSHQNELSKQLKLLSDNDKNQEDEWFGSQVKNPPNELRSSEKMSNLGDVFNNVATDLSMNYFARTKIYG
ncbi:442_t:CDS:2 [Acaulospora morrowiae]|uniref:442_t:CDS:1 n=1 Tax=Acaulospora morrowiae TaxID=94023 RepID=A0A9N9D7K0_9GLOM|nr:442_t:CDS:2 [Acaulospora morrowiae]